MANYYPEDADMATRAARAWPVLAMLAHQRRTMPYGELAQILGMPHHRPLRYVLGHIMKYCDQHGLPPLTAVIVKMESGQPGEGLTTAPDPQLARDQVFNVNWWRIVPPTIDELRATGWA